MIGDTLRDAIIAAELTALRLEASVRQQIMKTLGELEAELDYILRRIDPTAPSAQTWRMVRLAKLIDETNNTINEYYANIEDAYSSTMSEFSRWVARDAATRVNATIGVDLVSAGQLPRQMSAFAKQAFFEGAPSAEWWSAQRKSVQSRFTNAMRIGTAQGETINELSQRILGREQTATRPALPPILDVSRSQAVTLVRTSFININNAARTEVYKENSTIIKQIQWLATLDTRTTPICRALDGKRWTLPDYQPVGHSMKYPGPTAHWNCRSTQVPVLNTFNDLVKNRNVANILDRLDSTERASMDGPVPGRTTYEEWLRNQPASVQREVLGPGRYKLFQSGKVGLTDMVDQSGNPLTLEQLLKQSSDASSKDRKQSNKPRQKGS